MNTAVCAVAMTLFASEATASAGEFQLNGLCAGGEVSASWLEHVATHTKGRIRAFAACVTYESASQMPLRYPLFHPGSRGVHLGPLFLIPNHPISLA